MTQGKELVPSFGPGAVVPSSGMAPQRRWSLCKEQAQRAGVLISVGTWPGTRPSGAF